MVAGIQLDHLEGGAGTDTLTLDYSGALAGGRTVAHLEIVLSDSNSEYIYLSDGTWVTAAFTGFERGIIAGSIGDDYLIGGNAGNTFYGGAGADGLYGGTAADTFYGGAGNDYLVGGEGNDKLFGGVASDAIDGGAGRDRIQGGTGKDRITGGSEKDVFVFLTATDAGIGVSRDNISDFQAGIDKIDLHGFMVGGSFVGNAAFTHVAGQVRYNATSGIVSGDADGDGFANFEIRLSAGLALTATDIIF